MSQSAKITKVYLPEYVLPCEWAATEKMSGRKYVRSVKDAKLAFSVASQRRHGAWVMGGCEVVRADRSTDLVLI